MYLRHVDCIVTSDIHIIPVNCGHEYGISAQKTIRYSNSLHKTLASLGFDAVDAALRETGQFHSRCNSGQ